MNKKVLAGAYAKDKLTRKEVETLSANLRPSIEKHSNHCVLAGSYRRGKELIGDIDWVVTDANLENILAEIQTNFKTLEVSRQGKSVMTVVLQLGKKEAQVEFMNVKDSEYGSALMHSTGSGEFNQGIRGYAKGKGLILNQHGLFVVATKKLLASKFENEVFEALGLKVIPATKRDESFNSLKKEFMKDPLKNQFIKPDLKGVKSWKVKSKSNPTQPPYIVTYNGKLLTCQCKGFLFNKEKPRHCRHTDYVKKMKKIKV